MASTMLPYILSLSKGRLKDVCVRHRVSPVIDKSTNSRVMDISSPFVIVNFVERK